MHLKLAAVLMLVASSLTGQVRFMDTVKFIDEKAAMPSHPRILLLKGEERNLMQAINADNVWLMTHKEILRQCDSMLPLKPVEHVLIGVRLLEQSRQCLGRVFSLAYAWRMTRDKKYFDRAEKELLAVSAFADWNPNHYLDVAEMTTAVAIGYDWLFNELSENSRKIISEAILKKGIATSYDTTWPNYRKWLSVTNNWNQVCNTGMTFGALAVFEKDPALAYKVINRSIASIGIAMKDLEPDGAFAEGYTYWGYGTTFNVLFLDAIEKVFKTDYGLSAQQGFLKTAGYLENMIGPSLKCFNYSDASEPSRMQPAMYWFARKLNDPSLLWFEKTFLQPSKITSLSDRLLPALLLWGAGAKMEAITPPAGKIWVGRGKNPVALMRSSWTDSNAIFVGVKGGSPSVTHGHMDVGSFVMEAQGERWSSDLGMQDYPSLELKNIDLWANQQNGQRWEVFKYNNFAHSALTINHELQKVDGYGSLTAHGSDPDFLSATFDIGSLYKGYLRRAARGVAIRESRYVTVRDEVETQDSAVVIRWSMLTRAEVVGSGNNTITLKQHGKMLSVVINQPENAKLKTWTTDSPNEYDDRNPGTTLVGFEVAAAAHTKMVLDVSLIPGGVHPSTGNADLPLQKWKN